MHYVPVYGDNFVQLHRRYFENNNLKVSALLGWGQTEGLHWRRWIDFDLEFSFLLFIKGLSYALLFKEGPYLFVVNGFFWSSIFHLYFFFRVMTLPHNRRTSANIFLAALACSDSLHLLFTVHKWILSMTEYRYLQIILFDGISLSLKTFWPTCI